MYCSTSSLKRTHFLEEVDVGDDLPEEREGREDSIDSNPADDERFNNTSHIPRCLRIGFTLTSAYDNDLVNFGRQSISMGEENRDCEDSGLWSGPYSHVVSWSFSLLLC